MLPLELADVDCTAFLTAHLSSKDGNELDVFITTGPKRAAMAVEV